VGERIVNLSSDVDAAVVAVVVSPWTHSFLGLGKPDRKDCRVVPCTE